MIAFDIKEFTGRQPEICLLDNASNTCSILEQLPSTDGDWDRMHYFVTPQAADSGVGYKLLLQNWAVGNDIVEYGYDNLQVYRVNQSDFVNIKLAKELSDLFIKGNKVSLPVVSSSAVEYKLNLSEVPTNVEFLSLGQGYDLGWLLVTDETSVADYINAIIGRETDSGYQPQILNGWANAWDISEVNRDHTVTIFYAPQLLVDGGWLITLGGLGLLVLPLIFRVGWRSGYYLLGRKISR